ncbi:MAG: hypothetical protein NXH85_00920 [Pseudomonadaceae bacterium]|nr:hypothetical protein [Pseudomonadaceae bacterium]
MTAYDLLLIVHVLGWVFWLGTDIGGYIAAKRSLRSDYSVETRLAILDVGMLLGRAPRFAVPIVWATGMMLMTRAGFPILDDAAVIVIAAAWTANVWLGIFQPLGSILQVWSMRIQTITYVIAIVAMGGYGGWAIASAALPKWLAVKWLAFALVGIAAIWLERASAPAIANFGHLAESGSTPELEKELERNLKATLRAVVLIYVATLIAGISGLAKLSL